MILVNLLPEEYRQKRRTPVKLLIAVSAVVAINTSLFAYWAWTAFGVAAEVSSELAVLEDSMQSLKPQIDYHETLHSESKLFQSREQTLADITSKRISWTEKVDQIVDVVHRGGAGEEKYLVWLDGLTVDNAVNERKKTFGEVSANGNSGSPKFAQVANFLEDVQKSPLSQAFIVSSDPEGQQAIKDEELVPSEVWSFPFKLSLKSPEDREAARMAPEGKPAKSGNTSSDKTTPKADATTEAR
jgi:Tfp pilus assembly protein PilN